jgi:LPXTG-motif cell wall-anchored protein
MHTMEKTSYKQKTNMLHRRQQTRRWLAVVLCLALAVALGTFYSLTKEGQAQTNVVLVLDCPLEVHSHTRDCYDGDGNLVCGYADYVVHTHDQACYDEQGALVCVLPEIEEHKHTQACYEEQTVLVCGQEETAGHVHTDACYTLEQGDLVCEEEDEDHQHTEECYAWSSVLTCGQTEGDGAHTHGDSCYETTKSLNCGKLELHEHSNDCYDRDGRLICGQTQLLSHEHSEKNGCFREVSVTDASEDETEEPEEETQAEAAEETGEEPTEASEEPAFEEETADEDEPSEEEPAEDEEILLETEAAWETEQPADAGEETVTAAPRRARAARRVSSVQPVDMTDHVTSLKFMARSGVSWKETSDFQAADQAQGRLAFAGITLNDLNGSNTVLFDMPELIVPGSAVGEGNKTALYDGNYSDTDPAGYYYFSDDGDLLVVFTNGYLSYVAENDTKIKGNLTFQFTWDSSQLQEGSNQENMTLGQYTGQVTIQGQTRSEPQAAELEDGLDVFKGTGGLSVQSDGSGLLTYTIQVHVSGQDWEGPILLQDTLGTVSESVSYEEGTLRCGNLPVSWQDNGNGGKTITLGQAGQAIADGWYAITYQVRIDGLADSDFSLERLTNTLTWTVDGQTQTCENTYTFSRSALYKRVTGSDNVTRDISWQVDVNTGDVPYTLAGERFADTLPEGTVVKPETTVQVERHDRLTGAVTYDTAQVSADGRTITYDFPDGTDYYFITYTTSQETLTDEAVVVENTAKLTGSVTDEYTASQRFEYIPLQKTLDTHGKGTALDDGTVAVALSWSVTLNKQTISQGTTVNDYGAYTNFTQRLFMTDTQRQSLTIIQSDGTVLSPSRYTVTAYSHPTAYNADQSLTSDTGLFQITFTQDVKGPLTISYDCYADASDAAAGSYIHVGNNVEMGGDVVSVTPGFRYEKGGSVAKFTYTGRQDDKKDPAYSNVSVGLSNRITWVLRLDDITDEAISVEDILPEGLSYVPGTAYAELIPAFWGSYADFYNSATGTVKNSYFQINLDVTQQGNTLTFTVPDTGSRWRADGAGASAYKDTYADGSGNPVCVYICYQTAIDRDNEFFTGSEQTASFTNQASSGDTTVQHTAYVTRDVTGKYGDYDPDTGTLSYTVLLNPTGSDLNTQGSQLQVEDVLSGEETVLASASLQEVYLFGVSLDGQGNFVPTYQLERLTQVQASQEEGHDYADYTYTYDEATHKVTAYVPDDLACALVYSYQLGALDLSETVTIYNSATIYAGSKSFETVTQQETVDSAQLGGQLQTDVASLVVRKHDGQLYEKMVSGAVYQVEYYDAKTKTWVSPAKGIGTTGENGTVKLGGIAYDALCRLVELSAPAGYVLDTEPYYFVVQDTDVPDSETYWDDILPSDMSVADVDHIYTRLNTSLRLERFDEPSDQVITVTKSWLSSRGNPASAPANSSVTFSVTKTLHGQSLDYGTYTLPTASGDWSLDITVADDGAVYTVEEQSLTINGEIQTPTQEDGTLVLGGYVVGYGYEGGSLSGIQAGQTATIENKRLENDETVLRVEKQWFGQVGEAACFQLEYSTDGNSWQVYPKQDDQGQETYGGVLTAENDWKETISGLPLADENGNAYQYRVRETALEGFTTTYQVGTGAVTENVSAPVADGQTVLITNTSQYYTQVSVDKIWHNNGGTVMSNPTEDITVQLVQELYRSQTAQLTIQIRRSWQTEEYTLTVPLGASVSLKAVLWGADLNNYVSGLPGGERFDNTYEAGQTGKWKADFTMDGDRTVVFDSRSTWITTDASMWTFDAPASEDQSAALPDATTVLATVTLTKDDDWQYTWTGLPLDDGAGNAYVYQVVETAVGDRSLTESGYASESSGNVDGLVTITNTRTADAGYELPATGSRGTTWLYLAGAALVLGAALLYRKRKLGKEETG